MKTITLEVSLKPFYDHSDDAVKAVCYEIFESWKPLTEDFENVNILLWIGDGTEILEFTGNLQNQFDWGKYIGGANCRTNWDKQKDPNGQGLHTRCYEYTRNPEKVNYEFIKKIIKSIKIIGNKVIIKQISVGATFDPGPEFSTSDFKYKRHTEILKGDTLGEKSFVCCYSTLHADSKAYAGFPNGIPENTPFGTFFGRQTQHFLKAMEFDYLWLSNGFGFGTEAWGVTGAIFDGKTFMPEKLTSVQDKIFEFWLLFRKECDYPIQTRGTNLTVGIDYSTDGVNLKKIYDDVDNILPPPNSPWAAIDGNFGLELAGYMSRMASLPDNEEYLFRYYVHDPWWMNSPWMDRYEGYPHDIYLPMATSRANESLKIQNPSHLNLLTIDNSLGEMPKKARIETIPHLINSIAISPDEISPFLWVYPFEEYQNSENERLAKPFFEDYCIVDAINAGFPLNTVISTSNFLKAFENNKSFNNTTVVTPVPYKKSKMNNYILKFVSNGGRVILYGSLLNADEKLLKFLGVTLTDGIYGELDISLCNAIKSPVNKIIHDPLISDGNIDTVLTDSCASTPIAEISAKDKKYIYALSVNNISGNLIWIRGTNNNFFNGGWILTHQKRNEYFNTAELFTYSMIISGISIKQYRFDIKQENSVISIHRHDNLFYFAGYIPDTTTNHLFTTKMGAPILMGRETIVDNNTAAYHFERAFTHECRVFVTQSEKSVVSCREAPSISYFHSRRIEVSGLHNADVLFFPSSKNQDATEIQYNTSYPNMVSEDIEKHFIDTEYGKAYLIKNATGNLLFSERRKNI